MKKRKKTKTHRAIKKTPLLRLKTLFEYEYPSGHRVEVGANGVTIWDGVARRWIVDASTISHDNTFSVGGEIFSGAIFSKHSFNATLKGSYPKSMHPKK